VTLFYLLAFCVQAMWKVANVLSVANNKLFLHDATSEMNLLNSASEFGKELADNSHKSRARNGENG
jgi:hypothetical protein